MVPRSHTKHARDASPETSNKQQKRAFWEKEKFDRNDNPVIDDGSPAMLLKANGLDEIRSALKILGYCGKPENADPQKKKSGQVLLKFQRGMIHVTITWFPNKTLLIQPESIRRELWSELLNVHEKHCEEFKKVAVVVGMSEYTHHRNLPGAKNDAEEISKILSARGFEVSEAVDVDLKILAEKITTAICSLESDATFIFYYAGHSFTSSSSKKPTLLYLMEGDHPKEELSYVEAATKYLSLSTIREWLSYGAPRASKVFFWDGCRVDSTRKKKISNPSLSQLDRGNTLIAHACALGQESVEATYGSTMRGIWSYHLGCCLDAAAPNTNVSDVTMSVRYAMQQANEAQVPWDESNLARSVSI